MNNIPFTKYHGTGNDFILIDNRAVGWKPTPEEVAAFCHRRFGVGADGLMLVETAEAPYDFRMVYFNSDGNESSMCGNGGRCIVHFAHQLGIFTGESTQFIAIDGPHQAWIKNGFIQLEMCASAEMKPLPNGDYIGNTGSPHYVQWVEQAISLEEIQQRGYHIRHLPEFEKEGINVNFVAPLNENSLWVGTFERGVEAPTFSCGTGVTAAALAYVAKTSSQKENNRISIQVPGGNLEVQWTWIHGKTSKILLIGPATRVFEGIWKG